jgi:oligosaccharide repeat unit polymerase
MKINFFYFLLFNFFINMIVYFNEIIVRLELFSLRFLFIYSFIFIFISTIFIIYLNKNIFSLIVLFTLFYILFLYGMVITNVFSNSDDIYYYGLFGGRYLSEISLVNSILIINILFISVLLSYQIFYRDRDLVSSNYVKIKNSKFIYSLFYFFSILASIKFILEYIHIRNTSYVQLYLNGLSDVNYYSPIIKNSHTFLVAIYGFILQKVPSKRNFIICSFVFCLSLIFSSLKGARILSLLPLIFVFWYYYRFYSSINLKKQFKKSILLFAVLFIFFNFLKSSRNSNDFQLPSFLDLSKIILDESGMTIQAIASYIEIKNEVKSDYPFILEPILYPFFYVMNWESYKGGQSIELVKARNSFNHRFSYAIDEDYYLKGNALGSSMVSEAFQYGVFYLILIGFVFGYYISFLEKKLIKNSIILFLSPVLVGGIFIAPRESPFPNTWGFIKMFLLLLLFKLIIELLSNNFQNKINNTSNSYDE